MIETRTSTGSAPVTDRVLVPLTAGICLVLLAAVLKKIILVPASQLSSDMILFIIIYTGFVISYHWSRPNDGSPFVTKLWIGMILLVTLAIIALYAL